MDMDEKTLKKVAIVGWCAFLFIMVVIAAITHNEDLFVSIAMIGILSVGALIGGELAKSEEKDEK